MTTDINNLVESSPFDLDLSISASVSLWPAHPRDPSLDFTIGFDPLEIILDLDAELLESIPIVEGLDLELSLSGRLLDGSVSVFEGFDLDLTLQGNVYLGDQIANWVAWSKIGLHDFTIDETNEAGKIPMDWRGRVLELYTLDDVVVVYGTGGVTILTPHELAWGLKTIHTVGVLCKEAVIGTDFEHYFIDRLFKLYKLSKEGLELLDYSEYLISLVAPRLSLDVDDNNLYISDNVQGFVYNTRAKSFGAGPARLTGVGQLNGLRYVTSPVAITTPVFSIITDVYDLGTRKPKTIRRIEIGTNLSGRLEVCIESRNSINAVFVPSRWVPVSPNGLVEIPCYGIEFRFRLRAFAYEYFKVDYIRLSGEVHAFHYLERIEGGLVRSNIN